MAARLTSLGFTQARELHQISTEIAADEVFWMRTDSSIKYVNQSACDRLGYTKEELTGKFVWEWDPNFSPNAWQDFMAEFSQTKFVDFETEHQTKSGTKFPVRVVGHLIEHEGDQIVMAFVHDISKRKDAEFALSRYQNELESLVALRTRELSDLQKLTSSILDSAEAGIMAFEAIRDVAGEIIDFKWTIANPASVRITGKQPEELIGKRLLEVFPGNKDAGLFDGYVSVVESGNTFTSDLHYAADGLDEWFLISAVRHKFNGFTVSFSPVSELKRYQTTLHDLFELRNNDSLSFAEKIKEISRIGREYFLCTQSCTNIPGEPEDDQRTCNLLGQVNPRDEVIRLVRSNAFGNQSLIAFDSKVELASALNVDERDLSVARLVCRKLQRGKNSPGFIAFSSFERRSRPFNADDRAMLDLLGSIIEQHLNAEDQRNSEAAHHRELQLIMNAIPSVVWMKDASDNIVMANAAAARSLGFNSPDELRGNNTLSMFPERADVIQDNDRIAFQSRELLRSKFQTFSPELNAMRWVTADKVAVTRANGEEGIVVCLNDITDLEESKQKLAVLNESLENFAQIAAHDLQAPLRQSKMFADLLALELDASGDEGKAHAIELLGDLTKTLDDMRELVKDLHQVSRLETETIGRDSISLYDVVQRAVRMNRSLIEEAGANVVVDANLPKVVGNAGLLADVFGNLISNACRYGSVSDLEIRIMSDRSQNEKIACVIFEDNGVGIPTEFATRMFAPFARGPRSNEKNGTGLGLSICKRIVELHAGNITYSPASPKGAQFLIEFPALGAGHEDTFSR